MKNIIIGIIIFISTFSFVDAYTYNQVDKILGKYYQKIDKKYSNIDKKINRLKKINQKVLTILVTKRDRLSNKNIELLELVLQSVKNKIYFYEKQLKEISLNEILKEEEIQNKNCMYKAGEISHGTDTTYVQLETINNGNIFYNYRVKCYNGKLTEKKLNYVKIECDNGYEKDGKKCVEKIKKELEVSGPRTVLEGKQFSIHWSAEGYKYCTTFGEHIKLLNGNYWADINKLPNIGNYSLIAKHKNFSDIKNITLGIQCYYGENKSTSKIIDIKVIGKDKKDCGFYKGKWFEHGMSDNKNLLFEEKISFGKKIFRDVVFCNDGNIISKKGIYIKTECDNGYEKDGKKCVEKEIYEVNVYLEKKMGIFEKDADVIFVVDVHGKGIKSVEIIGIGGKGGVEIRNEDYDIIQFPEIINDGDNWNFEAVNEGEKELNEFTYRINFDDPNKKSIIIKKEVNLKLGNYIED